MGSCTEVSRVVRPIVSVLAATLLLTVVGCQEEAQSPTGPEATPLAVSAAQPLAFFQVSGGGQHTCGVTTDNRAYCWGFNNFGQLGDGTTTTRLRPMAVRGTHRFRQVSAGEFHTCGVTTDNRALCWGQGVAGELGDGTNTNRLTPVPVTGGRRFRQVDTGQGYTCGVSYPDNLAFCWGGNTGGKLGDGTSTSRSSPVAVSGGRQFRQVSAGGNHTCGVTTSDRAFCWGDNRQGQVGDGSTVAFRPTPSPVAGTRRFRQVDTGMLHTCGVTLSDLAFCWGNGRNGQMGDGNTKLSSSPRAVAGGLNFSRVSAGFGHTCGETTGNRAYCWGVNANGQLGDGTTATQRLTPVAVVGGLTFAQLSAGLAHTCGKTPASVAYCWGAGFSGQLGDGTATSSRRPVAVAGPT